MARVKTCLLTLVLVACATAAFAQTLPTSQPNFLMIYRETVKVGHTAEHAKVEAGWPAAYDKAKDPYTYIALVSLTGRNEAWFVTPFESQQAIADSMKREDDPALAPSLERLSRADAEQISDGQGILARARKDLSHGQYPDSAKQRFYSITIFRVKPGHEGDFEAAVKAYGAAVDRAGVQRDFRVYQVMAGMPSPTYLSFTSYADYGAFDQYLANGEAAMKAATSEQRAALDKVSADGLINTETIRFRLDPTMSYVPQSVRLEDPAFWMPKTANAMAKPAPKPAPKQEAKR
jgi:hypothetical protein